MFPAISWSVSQRPVVPRWETSFTIAALFLLTGAVFPLPRLEDVNIATLEGDPLVQALHGVVYAAAFALILARMGHSSLARLPGPLWFLVALVLFSVCWSDDPVLTVRRGGALVGTTVVGLYFGLRYSLTEQLRLIVAVLALAAAFSVLSALTTNVGIMEGAHDGAWRGVFTHKNGLGRMMVLLAVASLTRVLQGDVRSSLYWACFIVATVLMLLSQSRTALALYLGSLAAFPVLRMVRFRYTLAVPVMLATLASSFAGLLWAVNELDAISAAVGRDITLTGRTFLWQSALEMMWERPWLGYGYAAFWRDWDGPSATVWAATPWQPPHAHNGLLDLGLDLGLLGMGLFAWVFGLMAVRALRRARMGDGIVGYWPLMFLCFFVMGNATETVLLRQNNLSWVLFVAISVGLSERREVAAAVISPEPRRHRWRQGVVIPAQPLTQDAPIQGQLSRSVNAY